MLTLKIQKLIDRIIKNMLSTSMCYSLAIEQIPFMELLFFSRYSPKRICCCYLTPFCAVISLLIAVLALAAICALVIGIYTLTNRRRTGTNVYVLFYLLLQFLI